MGDRSAKTKRGDDGSAISLDRISEMPQHILHLILSLLPQIDAVRTSLLSKSWRHIGPTRPRIEFLQQGFNGNKKTFLSVLDKTLRGYQDRELCVQEFRVGISYVDSESISLLDKWIPRLVLNMSVKKFDLTLIRVCKPKYFNVPSIVFQAESLESLRLMGCQINRIDIVPLVKRLRTLSLHGVEIADETLEKIISCAPLIEYVTLRRCDELRTFKVSKVRHLKCFVYDDYLMHSKNFDLSIEIDSPSVESITIRGFTSWFPHRNYLLLPHLKSLHLDHVSLSEESLCYTFPADFRCLEELTLLFCVGFVELNVTSHSMKLLCIGMDRPFEAAIDAPNILNFNLLCKYLPSISFTTIPSHEWKSRIELTSLKSRKNDLFLLKLKELLEVVSHSQISLLLADRPPVVPENYAPFVIENLSFRCNPSSCSSVADFLNSLFLSFQPRNIQLRFHAKPKFGWDVEENKLIELLCKIFLMEREKWTQCFGKQILEDVIMEASVGNGRQWHSVEPKNLSECAFAIKQLSQRIRFRLKWIE